MGCTQLLLLALFAVFADLICNCFRGTCDRGCRGVTGTHPSPCPHLLWLWGYSHTAQLVFCVMEARVQVAY